MSPRPVLVLFDDRKARAWEPLALTRPIGELLFGCLRQWDRAERVLGLACAGHTGCPELAGFAEPDARPVLQQPPPQDRARLFLCSRAVPAWDLPVEYPPHPATVFIDGNAIGWFAPAGTPDPPPAFLAEPAAGAGPADRLALPGRCLDHVWDLIAQNSHQLQQDFNALRSIPAGSADLPRPFQSIGSSAGWLRVGEEVTIEPGVVLDFTSGPIWLADGVTVRAFTRLAGPAYVGRGSTILGGSLSGVSIGPMCKVRGEVEETVILGYSNKAHDGFLGHAYLGEWVNLGALTTNSDLKNNYGSIRIWTPGGVVDTGSIKLGCLLGDHVKTGIGTLLSTGTVIGAGSNVFGTGMPPTHVPPFSWGSGKDLSVYELDRFLATASTVLGRRSLELTAGMEQLLRGAWQRTRGRAHA